MALDHEREMRLLFSSLSAEQRIALKEYYRKKEVKVWTQKVCAACLHDLCFECSQKLDQELARENAARRQEIMNASELSLVIEE